ncbi:ABC transporter ATP-binding protein [Dactylosporangium sp. CA-092794]|uniref:ABC transporter ATP-binding protein n=1 Tax=Dactylosporangium sp. CA-092794 TaxID=3239929 RepID=UPI003D940AC7
MTGQANAQGGPQPDNVLVLENISKTFISKKYECRKALEDISFSVRRGEMVCVVGPSGCGKSTVLNIIAGLLEPDGGTITVNHSEAKGAGRLGYITQRDSLLPWRTVLGNVTLGLEMQGMRRRERRAAAREVLRLVGLEGVDHLRPNSLSGGMRKRVQVARALACQPALLLLDEPFGALDAQSRTLLQGELVRWRQSQEQPATAVFITHDLEEAVLLGDRVIVLGGRPSHAVHVEEINDLGDRSDPRELARTATFQQHVDVLWHHISVGEVSDAK